MPTGLIEPERQDGAGRVHTIKRRPQSANCLLELRAKIRAPPYDPFCLPLKGEDSFGEFGGRTNRWPPSPSGEWTIAFTAEWAQPAVAHSKRDPQMASTAGAAIQQHFCVRRADNLFRQPPFRPHVAIALRC
jgi:hypothetical protein